MQFLTIASLAALTLGVGPSAAQGTPNPDEKLLQVSTYETANCEGSNGGELTLFMRDESVCRRFSLDLNTYSVEVSKNPRDCELFIFKDTECSVDGYPITDSLCYDSKEEGWGSYMLYCPFLDDETDH
ncbi:hypothetical protein NM208_g4228 [Fusarium decemcellulare]|uniref:Uncharacterized protein n=1 Tax=Fusarium decemcellulare TaxID=57161 RepID=A0ACC1SLC9_9HYPO|nr:hypothetical protein NM208_g4228 [Fusarium decemcellulare]